jgi:hypothetical protein
MPRGWVNPLAVSWSEMSGMSVVSVGAGEELFLLHEWREHDPSRSAIRNRLAKKADFSVWLYIVHLEYDDLCLIQVWRLSISISS